jgi:hypothetical protein
MPRHIGFRQSLSFYVVSIEQAVVESRSQLLIDETLDLGLVSAKTSNLHPLVFGSIAEKVVKLVQCPLLLLRSIKPGAKTPPGRSTKWW